MESQLKKVRIAVFVSGGGSNLQAILDACAGRLQDVQVVWLLSNRAGAYALERAKLHKIDADFIDPKNFPHPRQYFDRLLKSLISKQIDLVCLAGFLLKLEGEILQSYRGRILNIHPALLPKYGGAGMYGHFVHEAVLRAGEIESGCTVHLVEEEFDRGPVLAQRTVSVVPGENAAELAMRVLEQEHLLYPEAIQLWKKNYESGDLR